jgi:glycoprotein 6-alpha-L-fucosyltransferase
LSISDNLGKWRRDESVKLAKRVQKDLHELQNPSNCEDTKKLVCDLTKGCGFGCQMHHIL